VGDILLSMLRGEEGRQAVELEELANWLTSQPHPDVICLSNALLLGLARRLKQRLKTRVVCFLQGEDSYLDALPEAFREPAWQLLREQAREADAFIAPNQYFAELMSRRLEIPPERIHIVPDGIEMEGYEQAPPSSEERLQSDPERPVTLGFFARMCRDKGLHLLVEAFVRLRHQGQGSLRLKVGGGCGPTDEPVVEEMKRQLAAAGLSDEVTFHPNLSRAEKLQFLKSLDVLSVPATYPEAFGLYLLEAMAAGVPVVQPRQAGFTELVEATGGGLLYTPNDAIHLAQALQSLLVNPRLARGLGLNGQRTVFSQFSSRSMAARMEEVLQKVIQA
jgi:glycosyltransferase involved in cell wall biosynthesis